MNLPKGIINIITDYAHTLFYIEELKDKTKNIFNFCKWYHVYENCVLRGGRIFEGIYEIHKYKTLKWIIRYHQIQN